MSVLIVVALFCAVAMTRGAPTPTARVSAQETPSFLFYIEYTDTTSVNNEYTNTVTAINTTYGTDYTYENLTDYTELEDKITGHYALLIMDQEEATLPYTTFRDIGNAWEDTLYAFVSTGGVVILLDWDSGVFGAARFILEDGELMTFGEVQADYPDGYIGTMNSLSVADINDPLANGLSAAFPPTTGTISYNDPDPAGTVVIQDNNGYAVVIHKAIGNGHVVYMGFDFFSYGDNQMQLLANALSLSPPSPPIPGFPVGAVAMGLLLCLGVVTIIRRRHPTVNQ
ncbi:MAG: hypothetical protein ACFFCO_06745 [Promethearchaeota archaeon]